MDYLATFGETWPPSRGNVGKYSLHGASGCLITVPDLHDLNSCCEQKSIQMYSVEKYPAMKHMFFFCKVQTLWIQVPPKKIQIAPKLYPKCIQSSYLDP